MARRKSAQREGTADAALGSRTTRLPTMSAESALGPPTRSYRSPMVAALAGVGGVAGQMADDDVMEDEDAGDTEGAELSLDETDELTGDAGDDNAEGDGSDDEEDAAGA